ncbi:MAG: hypothetical protein M0P74_08565 [Syntrophales bacterium]|nr:hypothetical protein [Syntrophales bacterium]
MGDIERRGGLIEEQHLGLLCQRPGEQYPLPLSAAQRLDQPRCKRQDIRRLHRQAGDLQVVSGFKLEFSQMGGSPHQHHLLDCQRKNQRGVLRHNRYQLRKFLSFHLED